MNPIQIIQGGQYGSEAKGAVAAFLAIEDRIDIAVRTGATNAGHTIYYNGEKYVMQQLPVGWVNPKTDLVIGAGALIDPTILLREIEDIEERSGLNIINRLFVDYRAHIHWPWHAAKSAESDRHRMIGATGKGCSEALISRLRLRGQEDFTVVKHADKVGLSHLAIGDTEALLNARYDGGARIQLEGTQGQLLDLCLGPYPYVTHKQTGPAQWMLEAGLSPALPTDIVMVVRTFPIRVAGNSGPLPNEISWPSLARRMNDQLRDYRGLLGPGIAKAANVMTEVVSEDAIQEFEEAVRRVAASKRFALPDGSDGLDQHTWNDHQRLIYRDALSNLNAAALAELPEDTMAELRRLFEMTTVTKKLRRIANIDPSMLDLAARQIRPHRVAVTFMNYLDPVKWNTKHPINNRELEFLRSMQQMCKAPVTAINRGPLPDHFIYFGPAGI